MEENKIHLFMSPARSIGPILIALSSLLNAGLGFLLHFILANRLSVEEYGYISAAISIGIIFSIIFSFGLPPLLLKIYTERQHAFIDYVRSATILYFCAMTAACLAFCLWILFMTKLGQENVLILGLFVIVISNSLIELLIVKSQMLRDYVKLSVFSFAQNLFRLILIAVVLSVASSLNANLAISAFISASLLVFACALYEFGRIVKFDAYQFEKNSVSPKKLLQESFPFGLLASTQIIYFHSGVLILSVFEGPENIGFYNLAFLLVSSVFLLPNAVVTRFLQPFIYKWAMHETKTLLRFEQLMMWVAIASGFSLSILIWVFSDHLILLLFNDLFLKSAGLIQILSYSIPAVFLSYFPGAVLLVQDNTWRKAKILGWASILCTVLNLALIPHYGVVGACWAYVICAWGVCLCYFYVTRKVIFANL